MVDSGSKVGGLAAPRSKCHGPHRSLAELRSCQMNHCVPTNVITGTQQREAATQPGFTCGLAPGASRHRNSAHRRIYTC